MKSADVFCFALVLLCFCCRNSYGKLSSRNSKQQSWRRQEYSGHVEDDTTHNDSDDAYAEMARYLKRFSQKTGFREYGLEEIENALSSLATAQSAWKSMDGLTHQLKNTFKKRLVGNSLFPL